MVLGPPTKPNSARDACHAGTAGTQLCGRNRARRRGRHRRILPRPVRPRHPARRRMKGHATLVHRRHRRPARRADDPCRRAAPARGPRPRLRHRQRRERRRRLRADAGAVPPAPRGRRRSHHAGRPHLQEAGDRQDPGERTTHVCKPANFPPDAPGANSPWRTARDGTVVAALSACWAGRSCGRWIARSGRRSGAGPSSAGVAKVIVVDVHAEATADKYLLGHHLKGRVSRRARHAHARPDRGRANPARRHRVHHATSA